MARGFALGLVVCVITGCAADAGDSDSSITDTDNETSNYTEKAKSNAPIASGVSISEVAVYQAVKVAIVTGGRPVDNRNAPIVAGRDALIRVKLSLIHI